MINESKQATTEQTESVQTDTATVQLQPLPKPDGIRDKIASAATGVEATSKHSAPIQSNTKQHAPNQNIHDLAVRLLLDRKATKVEDTSRTIASDYNKRRRAATTKLGEVLAKVWCCFENGETVGGFSSKKEWVAGQNVKIRWCQTLVDRHRNGDKEKTHSVRLDIGTVALIGDRKFRITVDALTALMDTAEKLNEPKPKAPEPSDLVAHVREKRHDVYIGRRHGSKFYKFDASIWGNHDHLELPEYEAYVRSSPELLHQLASLKSKVLGCWHTVADRRNGLVCHGDVLLKLIDEYDGKQLPPISTVKAYADGAVTVRTTFYNQEEVEALFDDCAKLNFVRGTVRGKERRHAVRIFCDVEAAVRRKEARSPLSEAPDAVKKLLAELSKHSGKNVNYAAVVEYRDGDDYIAPHQHNEDRGNDATVWIVSTGADRPFVAKPVNGDAATKFLATQGSLVTLSSEANETHLHSVPKCRECTGVRYSVNCKALPISIGNSEVQETIPSAPGQNGASSTSVANAEKKGPTKKAQTAKQAYEHVPSFLNKKEADDLYSMLMKQHSWIDNGDGSSQINYGYTYSRGGPAIGEIPDIPDFLRKHADRISLYTEHPVNFVQVHRFEPEHPVLPHYDPRGMCVPMITGGQERTFQVGDDGNSKSPSGKQRNRKVEDHSPESRILMRHGDLLVFTGNKVMHSMYPASKDEQFNPNGYDYRISILFRYTTEAMREFGVGECNRHGHEKQYRDAVKKF